MRGKHDNSMQMAAPIGFGEILGIPYDVIHGCACMHVHACVYVQQAQGSKTPWPIRSERTEWVQTWYTLGMLVYGLGYYGGIRTMYEVSTEWVRTEGGVG